MRKRNSCSITLFVTSLFLILASCDPNEDSSIKYSIPDIYDFKNIKYNGPTVRIRLLDTLGKVINSAKTQHISKETLLSIYNNTNSLFGGTQKLADKMAPGSEAQILAWFDLVDQNSPMQNPGPKEWFITPNGLDISQLVQKTIMGSVLYYQATSISLAGVETDDNSQVNGDEGTAMEHHWDEAFGYFGAPIDFGIYTPNDITKNYRDTNGDGKQNIPGEKLYFHGDYALIRDEGAKNFSEKDQTHYRVDIMTNFIRGRAAISNKDLTIRDDSRKIILEAWDKQNAANVIHSFNEVKKMLQANSSNLNDIHNLYHKWAEGRGFLNALKYSSFSWTTPTQWEELNTLVGENPSSATIEKLSQVNEKLREIYKFTEFRRDNF